MKYAKIQKIRWLVFFFLNPLFILQTSGASPLQESISFTLELKGDLQGIFEFSGKWGDKLEAELEPAQLKANSCSNMSVLARKVILDSKVQIEIWPQLTCTIQGQKRQFKLHKISFKADDSIQSKKLNYLALDIQNFKLELRDLSVQKSKKSDR